LVEVDGACWTLAGYRVLQASDGLMAMRIAQRHEGTIDLATDNA
jgi:hypothetical protein